MTLPERGGFGLGPGLDRSVKRGFGLFGVIFLVQWLVGLAFGVALACVAWHFVQKFW